MEQGARTSDFKTWHGAYHMYHVNTVYAPAPARLGMHAQQSLFLVYRLLLCNFEQDLNPLFVVYSSLQNLTLPTSDMKL